MRGEFAGEGCVITGWASGIECATAAAIAKDCAKVVVVDGGQETRAGDEQLSFVKGCRDRMTAALDRELAPDSLRVNAVCPGWVDTAATAASIHSPGGPDDQKAAVEETVPMVGRALADEVAPMFAYPASDEASYITCQDPAIDAA